MDIFSIAGNLLNFVAMSRDEEQLAILGNKNIRRRWSEKERIWYFAVVDVLRAITGTVNSQAYWDVLKTRAKTGEGVILQKYIRKVEMKSSNGRSAIIDAATIPNLLRIIQSVPSPKAEPFKRWLGRAGFEMIEEAQNPEKLIKKAISSYLRKGYSREWVDLRLRSISSRKALASEWKKRGITEGDQYSKLTEDVTKGWAGIDTKKYKKLKNAGKGSLRDKMTNLELILTMLSETSAVEISRARRPKTFDESRVTAKDAGKIAGIARKRLEKQLSHSVIAGKTGLKLPRPKV